jgi:type II secretory pathway component PulF
MPLFYYQALNANQQRVAGEMSAESLVQALAQLESQGLLIQSISSAPIPGGGAGENPFADHDDSGRTAVEQAALQQHLQRALERGRDILPALRAYAQEIPTGRRRRELDSVLRILERGDVAEAANTLAVLPGYWIPLLGAATASRDPGRILREFVRESERAMELQRQWWLTLSYPALLGGMAIAVLAVLSIFVIPVFREMFTDFGLQLPHLTLLILGIAEWIASGRILIVAAALVAIVVLLRQATRLLPLSVRNWCGDHLGVRWGRTTALARFSQFTADLLEAELETPQAVRLAGIATRNPPIRRAAGRLAGDLESGRELVRPGSRGVLTSTIVYALNNGISAASRIRLLREISAGYAERARIRLSWTRGIIEPLAICAIGLIVGATVLAMFLPLISLIQGLS